MNIKQKLWDAFRKSRSIRVINQYHGVPISCHASICMIGPDILALYAHPRQLERIRRERHTYLESSASPELIKAIPIAMDMQDNIVVLSNLTIAEPGVRQHLHELRIRPKELIGAEIQLNGGALPATLLDLVSDGDGPVQLHLVIEGQPQIRLKDIVDLSLNLSRSVGEVRLSGEVLRVHHPRGAGLTHLRILTLKKHPAAGRLKDYISWRKNEIEAELAE